MSERLCAVCNRMFTNVTLRPWGTKNPHHSTIADLLQAANEGCYICRSVTKRYQWSDITIVSSKGFLFTFSRTGPYPHVEAQSNHYGYYHPSKGVIRAPRRPISYPDEQRSSGLICLIINAACNIDNDDCRRKFNQTIKELNEIKEGGLPSIWMGESSKSYEVEFRFYLWPLEDDESYILQPGNSTRRINWEATGTKDNVIDL